MKASRDLERAALAFAEALGRRDYPGAYAMTSDEYRETTTVGEMRTAFEAIVDDDWGPIDPIEVGETMESWPGKQPADVGWAYVSIGGEMYSEAIVVVVARQNADLVIRQVEWGRP